MTPSKCYGNITLYSECANFTTKKSTFRFLVSRIKYPVSDFPNETLPEFVGSHLPVQGFCPGFSLPQNQNLIILIYFFPSVIN